jgi:hypothetical protein
VQVYASIKRCCNADEMKKWADLRLRCCCVFCGVSFLLLLPSSSLMVVLLLFQLEERKMYQMKDVVSLDINF